MKTEMEMNYAESQKEASMGQLTFGKNWQKAPNLALVTNKKGV